MTRVKQCEFNEQRLKCLNATQFIMKRAGKNIYLSPLLCCCLVCVTSICRLLLRPHPFLPLFSPPPVFLGYDGSELNMELFWILLFSSVCPLTWSQGVYGRNSLIFKCVSVQLYSKYIFIFTTLWFVGRSKKWHFKRFKRRASGRSSAN